MDFLEKLLDPGNRKYLKGDGFMQDNDHHDNEHDDDHDHHHHQYPSNISPQVPTNSAAFQPGVVCRKCSTQTVQGAKFCHGCGAAIEIILNCASCGSKLPVNALFCPQCGYKSG
jgi:ribosomal protein L40E